MDIKTRYKGRPILDIDLDGVCADYRGAFAAYIARERGLDARRFGTNDSYAFYTAPGWPIRNADDYKETHMRAEAEHLYATMKPIDGAPEALRRLAHEDVYVRIVTHRLFVGGQHRDVIWDTAAWLDANGIPYMSLCFTGLKDSVAADIHIDDSPTTVAALKAAGEHTVVFDQPYNRGLAGPRLYGWTTESVDTLLGWFADWPGN